jgi:hypothetical protein
VYLLSAWLLFAFIISGAKGQTKEAERIMAQAVEVLQWGRRVWANVPESDRGVIFSDTFYRGVRFMHMQQFMKASATFNLLLCLMAYMLVSVIWPNILCPSGRLETDTTASPRHTLLSTN